MVLGIGTDLIEVERMQQLTDKGDAWLESIFTAAEITYCRSKRYPHQHFAARFAAKEAFLKALGTGWRDGIGFADIEITNDNLGKPCVTVSGKTRETLSRFAAGPFEVHLSLSHIKSLATATVIIESRE